VSGPFERIATFYDGLVARYGHHPRAADYGRVESQRIKFEVLSQAILPTDRTLLDVGCGFADYGRFLAEQGRQVQYSGIDLSPKMIEEAQRSLPGIDLRVANVLDDTAVTGTFDVVNANGIFYLLGDDAWELMQRLVRRMFALSRRMVAFNSLSAWAEDQEPGEFYADPARVLDFCHSLSRRVVLRHDYHGRDFTVFVLRDA
jgi:SAM-dependent methyltransferase